MEKVFTVRLAAPEGMTDEQIAKYLLEAARWWSAHPDFAGEPISRLDRRSVKVRAAQQQQD